MLLSAANGQLTREGENDDGCRTKRVSREKDGRYSLSRPICLATMRVVVRTTVKTWPNGEMAGRTNVSRRKLITTFIQKKDSSFQDDETRKFTKPCEFMLGTRLPPFTTFR